MPYCERCGRKNEDGTRFCESCGQPLMSPAPIMVPPAPSPIASVPSHSPAPAASLQWDSAGTNFIEAMQCPMCGASVKPRDRECFYCHTTLIVVSQGAFASNADAALLTKSLEKWRAVLRQDPNNGEANYAVGIALLNQGLFERAAEHLAKAEAALPEHAVVHYNLALALFKVGSIGTVIHQTETAVRLDPSFAEANGFLQFLLGFQLSNANAPVDRVIEKYEAAVEACPSVAIFSFMLGCAYVGRGNFGFAVTQLRKAVELDPHDSDYLYMLGHYCPVVC